MHIKDWKKEVFTIPNLLSLFRLALIPVYIYIYLGATETYQYITAGTIMAVSCLTDLIDGKVARRFNMVSTLGKILDPLADKITQFTLTVCLSLKHPQLFPVLALFVVKELFQLIAGAVHLKMGKMLPGALMAGKVCTTVLFIPDRAGAVPQRRQYGGKCHCGSGRSFPGYLLRQLHSGVFWKKREGSGPQKRIERSPSDASDGLSFSKNTRRPFSEPPHNDNFLSPRDTACHGYAVGLSADISTASAFPTVSASVPKVYHTPGGDW